jgi:N-acyl-D-aspartate/D-glutamate deacylase
MSQHGLVIRGGMLVDGTGDAPRVGDLAIDGDRISAIGTDVNADIRSGGPEG